MTVDDGLAATMVATTIVWDGPMEAEARLAAETPIWVLIFAVSIQPHLMDWDVAAMAAMAVFQVVAELVPGSVVVAAYATVVATERLV